MIKRLVYDTEKLVKALGEKFHVQRIKTIYDFYGDFGDDEHSETYCDYITSLTNIKKIRYSSSSFVSDVEIHMNDGSMIQLSTATYQNRPDILNKYKNNILSPRIKVRSDYIHVESDLDEWLRYNGLTQKTLDSLRIQYTEETVYTFPYNEVIFDENGVLAGKESKKKMKLRESEINKAISEIEDKQVAYRIQYLLERIKERK